MNKNILVTGATGFIGNYVVMELLRQGHNVIASSSNQARASQYPWFGQVRYIPFDLTSFESSRNYYHLFSKPDLLIHLAWEGLPHYQSNFHLLDNFPRHAAFLENLLTHGLRDITVTGTCFEYGMQQGCLREDMAAIPGNSYGMAKNALREFLDELGKKLSFGFKWIRLFYMYGKGQNPNSLLSQLDRALEEGKETFNMSGGEQIRDFLPVETVADYIIRIGRQQKYLGVINCCSGIPVKVKDFVAGYLHEKKAKISLNLGYYPYPEHEPMQFWGDTQKLNKTINSI